MNILMALSQLEVTGAEVYATTVGNELTSRGHKVFYVSDTLTKPHEGLFFKLRFNKRTIPRRFWHVGYLVYLIKKYNIQLVHAHSRASSWSCHVACKLTGTPMVTTVHGRQPSHKTRKKFHAMGDKALPVCEAIRNQLGKDLEVPSHKMVVSRNGIETGQFHPTYLPSNEKPVITIIGRLTGPKGDLCYRLLSECLDASRYHIKVVTGSKMETRFEPFIESVEFTGYTNDVASLLHQSDLVIGAGRVAMESLLCGRPTLAIGEAINIGIVTEDNVSQAMATNFGDIGPKDLDIDFSNIADQVEQGLSSASCETSVTQTIRSHYELANVVNQLEGIYQDVYVKKIKRDVPVIMYHRFINSDDEKGVHGTYLNVDMLEKHFKLIKKMGFEAITFEELSKLKPIERLNPNKRYIVITVDDGYVDNLTLLLPLLEKYDLKAVVYAVTGESFNRWDVENASNPEKRVELMNAEQLQQLASSGRIEIGGHTLTHPMLSTLNAEEQQYEIVENKKVLEQLLGKSLTSFAYPYGDLDQSAKLVAEQAGYQYAVATNSGPLAFHEDKFQIRRIAIFPKTDVFGLWRKIKGDYLFRKFGKMGIQSVPFKVRRRNKVRIDNESCAKVHNKTRIRDCNITLKGDNNTLIFEEGANLRGVDIELDGSHCTVVIGKHCVIGGGCFISAREKGITLTLGERCMLSRNVKIMTSDGHDITVDGKRINPAKSITIGDRVWLADNVTVLKGVEIANGAIVGINSTVTKSIPERSIAVGNPAKVAQHNVEWSEELTY